MLPPFQHAVDQGPCPHHNGFFKEGRVPGGTSDERTPWPQLLPNKPEGNQARQPAWPPFDVQHLGVGIIHINHAGAGANREAAAALSPSRRETTATMAMTTAMYGRPLGASATGLQPHCWHHNNSSIANKDARINSQLQSVRVVSAGQTVLAVATFPQNGGVRGCKDNHCSAHTTMTRAQREQERKLKRGRVQSPQEPLPAVATHQALAH